MDTFSELDIERLIGLDFDQIIQEIGMSDLSLVLYILKKKYKSDFEYIDIGNDCMIRVAGFNVANVSYLPVYLHYLEIKETKLFLTGTTALPVDMVDVSDFFVCVDGKDIRPSFSEVFLNERINKKEYEIRRVFTCEIELGGDLYKKVQFVNVINGIRSVSGKINSMRFSPVADVHPGQYAFFNGYCVHIENASIVVEKDEKKLHVKYESAYQEYIRSHAEEAANNIISLRDSYYKSNCGINRKIWLFFDRIDKADDNAEVFFKYCRKYTSIIDADLYFVISRNCNDYIRMKQFGNVVDALSYEHCRLFLNAEFVITSQLNGYVENPFGEYEEYFRDIYHRPKVIFLQHGVTKDDQTEWLGNLNQQLYAIVTSSEMERREFLNDKRYFLDNHRVWLTGMPRFDALVDRRHDINCVPFQGRYILIMPSWRKKYMEQLYDDDKGVYVWNIKDDFYNSNYFKNYNKLLNDNKLLKACEKYGYRLIFMPHPIMQSYIKEFKPGKHVLTFDYLTTEWRELFIKSDLMITDYSSVAFDFAYMKKPVIYYQFDKNEFFENHSYRKGYFDYSSMGFGPVVDNYRKLVKILISNIKRNCILKNNYLKRVESFFEFSDSVNCQRLLNRLCPTRNIGRYTYKSDDKQYSFNILEGHIVHIEHIDLTGVVQTWNIYLENVFWGGRIEFPMSVNKNSEDRILWIYELSSEEFKKTGEYAAKGGCGGYICIFTEKKTDEMYFVLYTNLKQIYKQFVFFDHVNEKAVFSGDCFEISFDGCIYTKKNKDLFLKYVELVIDKKHKCLLDMKLQCNAMEYGNYRFKVLLDSIMSGETEINNPIHIRTVFEPDVQLKFSIGQNLENEEYKKFYYVPIAVSYYKDYVFFVRKNIHENYTLVVRPTEEIERTKQFRDMEQPSISREMYYEGKRLKELRNRPINLYFEKDSMTAEEGVWELFLSACKEQTSDNYFVLDKKSPQYRKLSSNKNVIERYSRKYYQLLYTADNLISTETSSHLNVHRSANKYIRKALLEKKLIFLQHGITYLKCQGNHSTFKKDREGEPTFIAVSSNKEADVVSSMLEIPKERCMVTGLPVFSIIEYDHIRAESENNVTVLLTWKPYEESLLEHFELSSYYADVKNILAILEEIIHEKNIFIVPHPKVYNLLMSTDVSDKVWKGSISEILKRTKLLITDYSSTCYNAFYQGAGVVFYQNDIARFEKAVGKLIPNEDEYIGYRAFSLVELKLLLESGFRGTEIDLDFFRKKEFIQRYSEINSFRDGKNIERIVSFLKKKKII